MESPKNLLDRTLLMLRVGRINHLALCLLCAIALSCSGFPQATQDKPGVIRRNQNTDGNRQHDFDFEIGVWKPHISRLVKPLTGKKTWVEFEGKTVVRKVWQGRANLAELEADGPAGHLEVLCLRLYNPHSHQWSLNYANSSEGLLMPPVVGEFKDGRGIFFGQDQLNGKPIFVRNVISDITQNSWRFEQAFSNDGGESWEVNFIETLTRVPNQTAALP